MWIGYAVQLLVVHQWVHSTSFALNWWWYYMLYSAFSMEWTLPLWSADLSLYFTHTLNHHPSHPIMWPPLQFRPFSCWSRAWFPAKEETSEIRALLWHSAPPCSYSRNLHLHKLHKHTQAPNCRATHELWQGSICHAAWRSIMLASLKWHNMT